ncbi:MAG: ABC transporter ATP-binding protein [Candidatus Dormibacteraeota bacterium]|nr:ABC transporter ATP-binding protein [Candidatus Dormibacteraeota bacterium]
MTDNRPAIELRGVAKGFRRMSRKPGTPWWRRVSTYKVALGALSLDIAGAGVTGIIGPNGSGKSTLIRILATLLTPDTGTARVFGHDVVANAAEVRRHINRVSVEAAFFKELSPWENMLFAARIYGSAGPDLRERVEAILARLGLAPDALDRPMKQLSRGQQQKVAITRSFLSTPSLLLLDEPTTGLDPRSKREVQDLLARLRSGRELTVLLCTHDLQEAEALCDRVIMLDEGRLLADGSPTQLRAPGETLEDVFMRVTGKTYDAEPEAVEV